MRKRNAMMLGSGFLLMVAGYVAWCWRPFYLPIITYHNAPPQEVVRLAEDWVDGFGTHQRLQFHLGPAVGLLAQPWSDFRRQVDVYINRPASNLMDIRISESNRGVSSTYRYVRIDGKWLDERDVR